MLLTENILQQRCILPALSAPTSHAFAPLNGGRCSAGTHHNMARSVTQQSLLHSKAHTPNPFFRSDTLSRTERQLQQFTFYNNYRGPGSSVGIATDYGLDVPGSNPGGDEIYRPSRPAMGVTQPPVQWVPGLSRG